MVNSPDAIVAVDPKVLGQDIVLLDNRASGAVLFVGAVAIVHSTVREVRLTVPRVKRSAASTATQCQPDYYPSEEQVTDR